MCYWHNDFLCAIGHDAFLCAIGMIIDAFLCAIGMMLSCVQDISLASEWIGTKFTRI